MTAQRQSSKASLKFAVDQSVALPKRILWTSLVRCVAAPPGTSFLFLESVLAIALPQRRA
eukprot:455386-Prymnesium_polylepis.1